MLFALFLLLSPVMVPAVQAADAAIVLSDKTGVYNEFATAFQQFSDGSNWRVRSVVGVDSLDSLPHVDLIIAVGAEATRASIRRAGAVPVLATLIPRQTYERVLAENNSHRPKGSTTAIFLDQPVGRLLAFTRQILPEKRRIGLLAGPETRPMLGQIRQLASSEGLGLENEEMETEANPVPPLNALLQRTDLLLALPDSAVYRRDNIRAILLTTYRHQRPVVGFSQALVTAGALAAIYSTPTQIARQAVDLVKVLHLDSLILPSPQVPSLFAISLNHNVAQAFGLTLPDEPAIRRALATDRDAR